MAPSADRLAPGLYLVATPIGTARDITLRALDILANAEVLAAEDTRTLRRLMDLHGVPVGDRQIVAYHDHNGPAARPRLLEALRAGKSVAYASEAGTPLVADPGYRLAQAAIEEGLPVTTAPGPSAVLAALSVSGLPSDRFLFAGFLPATRSARRSAIAELAGVPATLIFFESPKRVGEMLGDLRDGLGGARKAAVCRELTKRFEEVRRGTLDDLATDFADRPPKGEVVVLVDRDHAAPAAEDMEDALRDALVTMSVKDASAHVADMLGLPRRKVYQAALKLERET